jgi:hypothetical protein
MSAWNDLPWTPRGLRFKGIVEAIGFIVVVAAADWLAWIALT